MLKPSVSPNLPCDGNVSNFRRDVPAEGSQVATALRPTIQVCRVGPLFGQRKGAAGSAVGRAREGGGERERETDRASEH